MWKRDKDTARKQKRRLSYYSNILVVSDPANPENEGKVFLFRYGKKIFDMIQDQLKAFEFPNQDPVNPFDFWDGVDFVSVARNVVAIVTTISLSSQMLVLFLTVMKVLSQFGNNSIPLQRLSIQVNSNLTMN